MNVVAYLNNDDINKPFGNAQVYVVDDSDNQRATELVIQKRRSVQV